jgi:hypothetical protein
MDKDDDDAAVKYDGLMISLPTSSKVKQDW